MGVEDQREEARVPAFLRIKLKYADVDTFVEKYSTNLSRGGIFIATRTPKPTGSTLRFELCLEDASKLIRGEGTVSWVKEFDPKRPMQPHGMGVRFTKLDVESRALVDRMLAYKERKAEQAASARAAEDEAGERTVIAPAPKAPAAVKARPKPPPPPPAPPREPPSHAPEALPDGLTKEEQLRAALTELARLTAPAGTAAADADQDLSRILRESRLGDEHVVGAVERLRASVTAGSRDDLDGLLGPFEIDVPADPPAALAALLGVPPPYRRGDTPAHSHHGAPGAVARVGSAASAAPASVSVALGGNEETSAPAFEQRVELEAGEPEEAVVTIEADEPDEIDQALGGLFEEPK